MKKRSKISTLFRMLGLVKPLSGFMCLAVLCGTLAFLTVEAIPVLGVWGMFGGRGGEVWFWLTLCGLALGTIGVFLPILPTVPFYLATVFCFSQSSRKLHDWFLGTELYKKHLKSFVEKKGMLLKTKISIISTVTLLMGLGFFFMARKGIWIPCVILAVVWIAHLVYFIFGIKTITPAKVQSDITE